MKDYYMSETNLLIAGWIAQGLSSLEILVLAEIALAVELLSHVQLCVHELQHTKFPILHYLRTAQTPVHWINDAVKVYMEVEICAGL